MHALSTSELLSVWERGLNLTRTQQALLLLALACPETPPEALAQLSIGQRDSRLLTLRDWSLGHQLAAVALCPHCDQRLELTFTSSDIRMNAEEEPCDIYAFESEEYRVQFRLPNSLDLMAVANSPTVDVARDEIFRRCLMSFQYHGQGPASDPLPQAVFDAIVRQMAEADPQAEVQLSLSCPACNHRWQTVFDVVAFFWSEIDAWAQRILRDVHTLAGAYGWSEADILALSPRRRQCYLEMAGIGQ